MKLNFKSVHPTFVAEVSPVDLRAVSDRDTLEQIRGGMDRYAILVFRDQAFSGREQVEFAQRFDGQLHARTGAAAITRNRFGNEALTDISNVDEGGEIFQLNDRRRRLARQPPVAHGCILPGPAGACSMLFSVVVPPVIRLEYFTALVDIGNVRQRLVAEAVPGDRRRAALTDISNVDEGGEIFQSNDRRRQYLLGNRLWHTDASFQDPPGRYSMLFSVVVPPVPADTEFADMRAAYDALAVDMKAQLECLRAQHSIAYSRATLGFEFSEKESETLKGAVHPLVRTLANGRKSLYLASHASSIIDWPVPEARLLLRDLIEHATKPQFVYRHSWRVGDLVIWDNRATMHRGMPFDDKKYRRELRRVTTLDIPLRRTADGNTTNVHPTQRHRGHRGHRGHREEREEV